MRVFLMKWGSQCIIKESLRVNIFETSTHTQEEKGVHHFTTTMLI